MHLVGREGRRNRYRCESDASAGPAFVQVSSRICLENKYSYASKVLVNGMWEEKCCTGVMTDGKLEHNE